MAQQTTNLDPNAGAFTRFMRATEIDTRLLGMIAALVAIWVGFHLYGMIVNGNGAFLTPRNLWNITVQTSSVGIMACGMVLIIITRHIDLSVGSMLGFIAMIMGMWQVEWFQPVVGIGHWSIVVSTIIIGLILGTLMGALNGWLVAYRGIPAFIVTLGGLLVWRGAAFLVARGRTISPVDDRFALLGGGPFGSVGATWSWVVGLLGCAAILWMLVRNRRNRERHAFPQRPIWAEYVLGALGCAICIGTTLLVNAYPWPKGIVADYAAANNITVPEEGLFISHGFAVPVLILIVVAIVMTVMMTRTRFGRYVYAIGGNPDAALLAGINVKWMTVKIFALMGFLTALAGVVASARLNSATNALGTLDELYVIAAAVIGGTSLAGGVGTIYGAILGALVMQSLQSGMVLIGFDAAAQNIVVGLVLVLAVYVDTLYRKNVK
jgi:D-xylose transport system permease protein